MVEKFFELGSGFCVTATGYFLIPGIDCTK